MSEHDRTRGGEPSRAVLNRLARAIGHLESVRKMVEDGRDCSEVLVQLAAVRAALAGTSRVILREHLERCIADAVETNDPSALEELERVLDKLLD